jgi:hypothetical protein
MSETVKPLGRDRYNLHRHLMGDRPIAYFRNDGQFVTDLICALRKTSVPEESFTLLENAQLVMQEVGRRYESLWVTMLQEEKVKKNARHFNAFSELSFETKACLYVASVMGRFPIKELISQPKEVQVIVASFVHLRLLEEELEGDEAVNVILNFTESIGVSQEFVISYLNISQKMAKIRYRK